MIGSNGWSLGSKEEADLIEKLNAQLVDLPSETISRIYDLAKHGHPDEAVRQVRKLKIPAWQKRAMIGTVAALSAPPGVFRG